MWSREDPPKPEGAHEIFISEESLLIGAMWAVGSGAESLLLN
jgi:hypothetical protein